MFTDLLSLPSTQHALLAGLIVSIVAGVIGPFVVMRNSAFAVHGVAELAFTGAAGALLLHQDPIVGALVGSVVVGVIIGFLSVRQRERDSVISTLLAFGLGIGILFLHYYHGYANASYNLLFGQISSVSTQQLRVLLACTVFVVGTVAVIYRPLLFASVDPEVARARGVAVRTLSVVFMVLLAFAVAEAVQVVGVLLVLALIVTPAAAAQYISTRPIMNIVVAGGIALLASDGGIVAALKPGIPPSVFVTTISMVCYLFARFGYHRLRQAN